MISSTNLISLYFIRDTGRASSQPSRNLSNSFPDGIPVGNLIPFMRREFPMGSHNLLFGYRFLSCSDPKLNLGLASEAIFAFSAASIFRLGFFIIRSVYHDGADASSQTGLMFWFTRKKLVGSYLFL